MKTSAALVASFLLLAARIGAAPPATGRVRAGAAAVDIEADDSMVIGGGIGPQWARGQEGRLRAVATVIEAEDGSRAALIACDVLMLRRDRLDEAARSIEKELGIPMAAVLVNATHTHHAPSTATIHGYERNEAFCERVRDGIVAAARAAWKRIEGDGPHRAEMLFWLGEESSVGQNSRLLLSDGSIYWIGPRDDVVRPTGPFDPELPVLAFRRDDGGHESVIFNHSTHLIGAYERGKRSPGFYGLAAQDLERDLGGTVTFIAGAFGSTHALGQDTREMVHRIKGAVREALASASPRPVRSIRALRKEVAYRVRRFDEAKEDAAVVAYATKRCGAIATEVIETFRKMRSGLASHQGEERRTWVQALVLGDIAWVGIPGECFTRLGIRIKRRSPYRFTYVAGVANDYIGYLPDEAAYDLGGYQVWTGLHSVVERGTGEMLADAAVGLLEELARKP